MQKKLKTPRLFLKINIVLFTGLLCFMLIASYLLAHKQHQHFKPSIKLSGTEVLVQYYLHVYFPKQFPNLSQTALFLSHLKWLGLVMSAGFLFLSLALFLYLRRFINASHFVFKALTFTNKKQKQKGLCYLTHNHNPYLKPVKKPLLSLLSDKTFKPALSKKDKDIYFSHIIKDVVHQAGILYPDWTIQTDIDSDILLPVFADHLFQSIWELVKNAVDTNTENKTLNIRTVTKNDEWFCCTVSDKGPGMHKTTLTQACLPYFTTKPQAIGMGLTLVDKTLSRLGGLLHFDSPDDSPGLSVSLMIPLDYIDHIKTLKNTNNYTDHNIQKGAMA